MNCLYISHSRFISHTCSSSIVQNWNYLSSILKFIMVTITITPEYLEGLFKQKIKVVKVDPGSADGDNYVSQLFALKLQLEDEETEREFFFKTLPAHNLRIEWLKTNNCFHKEYMFYSEYIPKINKLYAEKTKYQLKFPGFYKGNICDYSKEGSEEFPLEDNFICMEDMRQHGFGMDRFREMTLDHLKLLFDSFALNHAGSWAYKNKHGIKSLQEHFPYLKEALFIPNGGLTELIYPHLGKMMEAVKNNEGEGDVYKALQKLHEKKDISNLYAIFTETTDEDVLDKLPRVPSPYPRSFVKEPWLVQCSGDVWKPNCLFKYDKDDKPIAITQIDFQFVHESCPTVDMLFFLATSTSVAFRKKHTNELLEFYVEKFLGYCKALGTPPLPGFNLETMKARFHRTKFWGFLMSILAIPFAVQKPKESFDDKLKEVTDKDKLWANAVSIDANDMITKAFVEEAMYAYEEGII